MSKQSSSSISKSLSEIAAKKHDYETAQDKLVTNVVGALQNLINECTMVEGLRWTQYTPHFNDGDECTFNIHAVEAKLYDSVLTDLGLVTDLKPTYGYGDDNYKDVDSIESDLERKANILNHDIAAIADKSLKELANVFSNLSGYTDSLKHKFGDHAQITLTKEGLSVEEYEHD